MSHFGSLDNMRAAAELLHELYLMGISKEQLLFCKGQMRS